MKIKWTKADAKRAEKMGWGLVSYSLDDREGRYVAIVACGPRFKSDEEAIDWALTAFEEPYFKIQNNPKLRPWYLSHDTCRKALFLCAKG